VFQYVKTPVLCFSTSKTFQISITNITCYPSKKHKLVLYVIDDCFRQLCVGFTAALRYTQLMRGISTALSCAEFQLPFPSHRCPTGRAALLPHLTVDLIM